MMNQNQPRRSTLRRPTSRRFFISAVVFALYFFSSSSLSTNSAAAEKEVKNKQPNILWLSTEDISSHLHCYGYENAITPNLDRLAKQGVKYTNAFTVTGVCATCRSSIITGMYPSSIGTQHMRCKAKLPAHIKCFPEYLRKAGYYCTNNSKTDYNFPVPKNAWDASSGKAHWKNKPKNAPFFAVFNYTATHESKVRASEKQHHSFTKRLTQDQRQDARKLSLPPYYPDTKVTRREWAKYYELITAMDYWIADKLQELEDAGLADDTILIFWSDHGVGLPRSKRWVYDSGTHVPLIIKAGKNVNDRAKIAAGSVDQQLVSFLDFAPTMLNLAGVEIPKHMQGRAFLGDKLSEPRKYVHGTRDRMDERYDLIRAVRDKRYRYIRNYMPEKPYSQFITYREQGNIMKEIRRLDAAGKLSGTNALFMRKQKPVEEFYDLEKDPHEVNNLIDSKKPEHQAALNRLRSEHLRWVFATRDTGFIVEPLLDEKEKKLGSRRAILQGKAGMKLLKRLHTYASASTNDAKSYDLLIAALNDSEAAARYWAVRRLSNHRPWAEKAEKRLSKMLQDESSIVRIAAARAACANGQLKKGLNVLQQELANSSDWGRVIAALELDELGEQARPALKALKKAKKDKNRYVNRVVSHAISQLEKK